MSNRAKRRASRKGKSRRVLVQRVARPVDPGRRSFAAAHPIARLTEHGIDWGTWPEPGDEIGYGMHPYRGDDCLVAAIATCTQVPIEQVPDLAIDRRVSQGEDPDTISRTSWDRIAAWAKRRDLVLGFSEEVHALQEHVDRWIGVVDRPPPPPEALVQPSYFQGDYRVTPRPLHFQGHCLVMARDHLLFDPSCSVRLPRRASAHWSYDPSEISYGIVFMKEN